MSLNAVCLTAITSLIRHQYTLLSGVALYPHLEIFIMTSSINTSMGRDRFPMLRLPLHPSVDAGLSSSGAVARWL